VETLDRTVLAEPVRILQKDASSLLSKALIHIRLARKHLAGLYAKH
jgi:hypothetical protein